MNQVLFSSKSCEWATPQTVFCELNEEFNFTLDPCATAENAKCKKYYTKADDGLNQDWGGETVFCNPPYGKEIAKWIEKCAMHAKSGGGGCSNVDPGKDRHTRVSRVHLWQGRNQIYTRQT